MLSLTLLIAVLSKKQLAAQSDYQVDSPKMLAIIQLVCWKTAHTAARRAVNENQEAGIDVYS